MNDTSETTSPRPAIAARSLDIRIGRSRPIRQLDLELQRGEIAALVGRNGSGKSTLMRGLVGLVPRAGGSLRVLGLDPGRNGARIRRSVGYVADRWQPSPWMRVRDALAFQARFHPTWNADEQARLATTLDVDLQKRVSRLSKGEAARCALVLALSHEPELLLLDEPFSGIDPEGRREILARVIDHVRERGRSVLVASHATDCIERLADRVLVLHGGRIARNVRIDDIADRFVRLEIALADEAPWQPPRGSRWIPGARGGVLEHDAWRAEDEHALRSDPRVESWRALPSGLDDYICATGHSEACE